jgi:hypothetical protein
MNTKYCQWIAGERRGEVMIYDSTVEEDGIEFICFKDGSRINKEFVLDINLADASGKMMAEVESPDVLWKFNEEWVGRTEEKTAESESGEVFIVEPFVPGRKVVNLVPPRRTNLNNLNKIEEQYITKIESSPVAVKQFIEIPKIDIDPVSIMLNKSKKVETELNMTLTINLPSRDLFNVIKENFDLGSEKTINYIVDNLDLTLIKESLKSAINSLYNEEIEVIE